MKTARVFAAVAAFWLVAAAPPQLAYRVSEGQNTNLFVQDGTVAAHVVLRAGTAPRLLVAFPAGNSGVGLWFAPTPVATTWRVEQPPVPIAQPDAGGRMLHGVRFTVSTDAPRLEPKRAVLSSVRFLRDYEAIGTVPPEVETPLAFAGRTLDLHRDRADGAAGYRLGLAVSGGSVVDGAIVATGGARITLTVTALTGETPLTPLRPDALLNDRAAPDPAARNALRFLSYREKFLAGSWRFNTYFGRDTLMSVRLLMPVLQPAAIEAGLNSVLSRLSDGGEVAHEEGIGEFAVVEHARTHSPAGPAATLDYGMIDGGYLLAPVAATYLLDHASRDQARRYLASPLPREAEPGARASAGALLVRNLKLVIAAARPFAGDPRRANLVAIKPGRMTGEWRDSNEGLGRGTYPYDVNAVLVPAALDAAARLFAAGLLDPYLGAADRTVLAQAPALAAVWQRAAPPLFRVDVPAAQAVPAVRDYARALGVPSDPAVAALGRAPLVFHALALAADGAPVQIINSDEGFALLFGAPAADDLDRFVMAIMRPFPAGLMTPAGLLVANPVLAGPAVQARFTPAAYHGTVVWSWQQALLAAGFERQLARRDLPPPVRARLVTAQAQLWQAIAATRAYGNSELWSWRYADGGYHVVPFGAGKADVDESNAAQLWSTVYLAVRPPR